MSDIEKDNMLLNKVTSSSKGDKAYWSFKGRAKRQYCHALIQYPAMMVPAMQGELIDAVLEIDSNITSIIDPFVGSGTTLGEAMCRGLDFVGIDINPLSILACEVKSGPLYIEAFKEKCHILLEKVRSDIRVDVAVQITNIDKWFTKEVQLALSKIYRAIQSENSKWARKIFWLCMSNTVRTVCNSRGSTFKLHIKSIEQIGNTPNTLDVFTKNIEKTIVALREQKKILSEMGSLNKSISKSKIKIIHTDTSKKIGKDIQCDLLVSSPPYGDNNTTVTYGQFSYLSLKWIDEKDIDNLKIKGLLETQNKIDSSSLGGSIKGASEKFELLKYKSSSLCNTVKAISAVNSENVKKLITFVFDLDLALDNALLTLRKNAYMIWTLGNRRISNIEVPLDKIMREILEHKGCVFIHQVEREILSKRMAIKNSIANTMDKELILMMRK
ncbi:MULTISPECIES: DNA methyltransferase [unclassified Citrobacter]|uniref:DNA methyltransferase n=1 Tax=unclassified Citrobacter TaxID=2644389 RepID=UPI002577AC65|nr:MULTISPECIES: DNA methyltransferase [unclassified Citrobacter]MDM2995495.1 site-specific DNA-methyltransferase [Citrobacter sp. CK195]MDM3132922.1 site-specific DNA-methyltransferase [Citrobacter sp. CK205]